MTEHPMTEATPLASEQITQEDLISREAALQACRDARAHAEKHYGVAEGVGADMAMRRIAALSASPVPVGWKLVPITPTQEMFDANMRFGQVMPGQALTMDGVRRFWRMMLDSAPASPAPSGQGVSGLTRETIAEALHQVARKYGDQEPFAPPFLNEFADAVLALAAPAPTCAPVADRGLDTTSVVDREAASHVTQAPSCAPGEVERYVEVERGVFVSASDYKADPQGCRDAAATPSQGRDAATVERCVLDMDFANTPPIDWSGHDWSRLAAALAIEPHQHGAGNGEKHGG